MNNNDKQRGNVLFIILIAVALFAALSYAVTQSNRGGTDVNEDMLGLKVDVMFNQVSFLRSEIMRDQLYGDIVTLTPSANNFYDPLNGRSLLAPPEELISSSSPTPYNERVWELDFTRYYFNGNDIGTPYNDQYLLFGNTDIEACELINERLNGNRNIASLDWTGTASNGDIIAESYSGTHKDLGFFSSTPSTPGYLNVYEEGCFEYLNTSVYYTLFKIRER